VFYACCHATPHTHTYLLILIKVFGSVHRTPDTNVDGAIIQKEPLLGGSPEWGAVGERLSEVGVPRIQVSVKVDESNRAKLLACGTKEG
jgi:hypothetical protein